MTVVDLSTDKVAWEYQFDKGVRPMTIETNPDGSTKRIFVQLSDTDGFAVVDFAKREEVARIKLPDLHTGIELDAGRAAAPSHGIGVSPDGKTLWVTSIPQNAVFAYSLADLSLHGQVALPDLKLPGRSPGRRGAQLGHVRARRQDGLHLQRRAALGHRRRHGGHEGTRRHPGRRSAQAHQHDGDELIIDAP